MSFELLGVPALVQSDEISHEEEEEEEKEVELGVFS
jgi:hypothetical protein